MGPPRGEADWIERLGQLIEEGQCFLAYDLATEARQAHPDSHRLRLLAVLALIRGGAVQEARKVLADLTSPLEAEEPLARQILEGLRAHLPELLTETARPEDSPDLDWVTRWADQLARLGRRAPRGALEDLDTLRLMAQVHGEIWRQQGDLEDLRRSRDAHLRAFRWHRHGDSGVHAARQSWLLGERDLARAVAVEALEARGQAPERSSPKEGFLQAVNEAECRLLTGHPEAAEALYRGALAGSKPHYAWVVEARQRLLALAAQGFPLPGDLLDLLRPPVILIGAGQPLDPPWAPVPLFPAAYEDVIRRAIQERLDALDPQIGYSSAGAGSDLLFVEAMLERDAEVHLVLPCAAEDFARERVAHAGPRWERRFRQALKLATSVTYATDEAYLGHDWLFRFNNQIIDGLARLRADLLGSEPYLLLVWDYAADNAAGTAADFMDHWPDPTRLRLIDLDEARDEHPELQSVPAPDAALRPPPRGLRREPQRVPKTLLFADIQGFSKLREEDLPGLWGYLAAVKEQLDRDCAPPDLVESWGDALYVVMPGARAMLRYAFALQDCFARLDPRAHGLPHPLSLRVGLHAGPVYTGQHPLTGRPIVYGSHVSRTARIEPVTVPGHVYASQQFVALLTAEETAFRAEREAAAPPAWYACEYLGILQLAKKYGNAPVYHLLPRTPPA